jgi:hypothetical protein
MLLRIPKNMVLTIALVLSFADSMAIAQIACKSFESMQSYSSISNSLYSFEATGSVDLPLSKRKISKEKWTETLCHLLQTYFQRFKSSAMLTSQSPPKEFLQCVKGYVTGEDQYWEADMITLDHIETNGTQLRFECKIQGVYVKLKTPFMSKERLAEGTDLEKEYAAQIQQECWHLIETLITHILKY